jgi:anti-sigma B factor antagonist
MPTPDPYPEISSLDQGVTRVRLAGEVDIATAPQLGRWLDDLVHDGHTRLLIDLSEATFIDSTGIGVLLHTVKQLRRRRGRLAVLCPDPAMRGLFELVGHNLLFPVDETLDRALAHLRPLRRFGASARGQRTEAGSSPRRSE